jgi:alkylhydroperoxidase family enzyme
MRVTVTPEQVRQAFEAVMGDPSFDESRGLVERGGMPVEMLRAMALRPEILRAFGGFGNAVYPGGLVERRIKELVILAASQANKCQFCFSAHVDIVDIEGIVDDPVPLLADPTRLPPRERVAVEYTQAAMRDSNRLAERLARELHEQFTDPELVEISFLIGYITMLNTFNNLLEVRYHGDYRALLEAMPPPAEPSPV